MIIAIAKMVKADMTHQKHQALMTFHCRYKKKIETAEPAKTRTSRIRFKISKEPRPMTKKEAMAEITA